MIAAETIAASTIQTQVTVCPVSVSEIFDAPNAADLLHAYAEECLVPDAQPQRATYEVMERAGVLKCFAAYVDLTTNELDAPAVFPCPLLVGFVSVLCAVMPHNGKRMATPESVFVDSAYRSTGAGDLLLDAAEQYATETGCIAITGLARVGSPFEKVLSRRAGYQLTHSQHTRWLT